MQCRLAAEKKRLASEGFSVGSGSQMFIKDKLLMHVLQIKFGECVITSQCRKNVSDFRQQVGIMCGNMVDDAFEVTTNPH